MRLLEADASTSPLLWYMDPSTILKGENNLDMIKTSSRLDSKLSSRIGEPVMTGSLYSTPSCRVFSDNATSYRINDELRKPRSPIEKSSQDGDKFDSRDTSSEREHLSSPPTQTEHHASSCNSYYRCSDNGSDDANNEGNNSTIESKLNGYINGFIVNANQYKQIDESEKNSQSPTVNRKKEYHNEDQRFHDNRVCENRNGNNNRIVQEGSRHTSLKPKDNANHSADTQYNNLEEMDNTMNGSDILKKMYASFGANASTNKRLPSEAIGYQPNFHNNFPKKSLMQGSGETPVKSGVHGLPESEYRYRRVSESRSSRERRRSNDICPFPPPSMPSEYERNRCKCHNPVENISDENKHSIIKNNSTRCSSPQRSPCYPYKNDLRHEVKAPIEDKWNEVHKKSVDKETSNSCNRPEPRRHSPVHTIDSLLSKHKYRIVSPNIRTDSSDKIHKTKYSLLHRRDVRNINDRNSSIERNSEQKQFEKRRHHLPSGEDYDSRQENSSSHEVERRGENISPARSPRGVGRNEEYNEKSREIFRRDKEIIENSLRQNKQLPFEGQSNDVLLQSPYWLNPSALAAFQANLLSSFPHNVPRAISDPNILLRSSLAAAAAVGNPLALGMNPCLMNPYLLRGGFPGSEASTMAYHQAIAQEILRNQAAFNPMLNSGLAGNMGSYPNPGALVYGNIPFQEASPIAAAIAATMRQKAPPLYPNGSIPYQSQTTIHEMNKNENVIRKNIPDNSKNSPPCSPPPHIRRSSFNAHNADAGTKRRRLSADTNNNISNSSTEGGSVDATAPESPSKRNQLHVPKHTSKHSFPPLPKLPLKTKRKLSPSPRENSDLPKKKSRTTLDMNDRELTREFPPLNLNSKSKPEESIALAPPPNSTVVEKSPSRPSSYKNLTRERRLVANARERTRVHTISSAFEDLRQQIPSYSCNQKLSKLAILRIACSYIQSLSVLAGRSTEGTFKESVDQCTRVLQAESRARSRRKSNKAQIDWEVANYEAVPSASDKDPRGKSDGPRRSHGTAAADAHRVTAAKSLSCEGTAQVHDEKRYHRADDSSPHEFSRDSYPFNKTRSEDSNDSCNESHENMIADNVSTADDSLNASREQINGSPESDMDGGTWPSPSRSPVGDIIAATNTWRDNNTHNSPSASLCYNVSEIRSRGNEGEKDNDNGEEQQNDLINVED